MAVYSDLTRLRQHFDVMHIIPPLIEPQDIPMVQGLIDFAKDVYAAFAGLFCWSVC